ncbi:hypothetical protein KSP39_PZI005938 [Platanthera zijinensis]|uniref:Uncharacterized protein n=1 Tax=Platanthera zijinensis TaxID=2320716 RepID=A0AAP0BT50_9ASPA
MTDVHGVAVELAEHSGLLDKLYELCCVDGSSNASIATKNGGVELLTSLCDFLHGRSLKLLVSALRTLSSIIHVHISLLKDLCRLHLEKESTLRNVGIS